MGDFKVIAEQIKARYEPNTLLMLPDVCADLDLPDDAEIVLAAFLWLYNKWQAAVYLLVYKDGKLIEQRELLSGMPEHSSEYRYQWGVELFTATKAANVERQWRAESTAIK